MARSVQRVARLLAPPPRDELWALRPLLEPGGRVPGARAPTAVQPAGAAVSARGFRRIPRCRQPGFLRRGHPASRRPDGREESAPRRASPGTEGMAIEPVSGRGRAISRGRPDRVLEHRPGGPMDPARAARRPDDGQRWLAALSAAGYSCDPPPKEDRAMTLAARRAAPVGHPRPEQARRQRRSAAAWGPRTPRAPDAQGASVYCC